MKILKRVMAVAVMVTALWLPQGAFADCDYTHGELVDHLILIAGLSQELPSDIGLRSADEAYLIKVRLLLTKGFPEALDGFERPYIIDRGYFISLVFESMKSQLSCKSQELPDKVACLKEKKFLPEEIETRLCKECQSVTHGELIMLIVKLSGLEEEIQRQLEGKNADEQYRIEVNYLLSLAFPKRLDGYTREFMIPRGYFAEVMYDIFRDRLGCPATTTKEKAICLARAGYLSSDDLARTLCRDEVIVGLLRIPPDEYEPGDGDRTISKDW